MKHFKLLYLCIIVAIFCFIYPKINLENVCLHRFLFNRAPPIGDSKIRPSQWHLLNNYDYTWMDRQIEEDLLPYANKKISLSNIHAELIKKQIEFVHLKILNQKVHVLYANKHVRAKAVVSGFEELAKYRPLPNVEFIICIGDKINPGDFSGQIPPVFVFAKTKTDDGGILMPDFTCFSDKTGSYSWQTHISPLIKIESKNIPWEKKLNKAIWRGATSGIDFSSPNWVSSPRVKLCVLALKYDSLLDAKFSYLSQMPVHQKQTIKKILPLGDFLSPQEHLIYKYLVYLDGNTASYPGLHWRLLSNSVVLKQESNETQWYYRALKPYEHYIPVKEDLSDLIEKIRFAQNNDELCKLIADNATEFANQNLSNNACYYYLEKLLIAYSKQFFPLDYEKIGIHSFRLGEK